MDWAARWTMSVAVQHTTSFVITSLHFCPGMKGKSPGANRARATPKGCYCNRVFERLTRNRISPPDGMWSEVALIRMYTLRPTWTMNCNHAGHGLETRRH